MVGWSQTAWPMLRPLLPQEAPTWEKIGLGGIALALLWLIVWVVKKGGPATMKAQAQAQKELVDRLIESQDASREQQERFHKERTAQMQSQHEVLVSHLVALMKREDKQDAQLDSLRGLLRRLSTMVAAQKVTDPKDVMKLVDGVIAAGDVPIPGYEREALAADGA